MKPTASPRWKRAGRPSASSRARPVTAPVRTSASASSIASPFAAAPRVGSSATAAARPACWERVGTTKTFFSDSSAARSAAISTFGEFGSTTTSSAGTSWMPASSS